MNTNTLPFLSNPAALSPLPILQQDTDLQNAITALHLTAKKATEENRSLEAILNTAAKNLPAYIKIVKSHLEELAAVLQLDSHQNQQLQYDNLPDPLRQLVQLFQHLNEADLSHIEWLSREAQQWVKTEPQTDDKTRRPLTEEV